jgi:hypothetical protein
MATFSCTGGRTRWGQAQLSIFGQMAKGKPAPQAHHAEIETSRDEVYST